MEDDSQLIQVYCKKCETVFSKDCVTYRIHTTEYNSTEYNSTEFVKIFNGDYT